MGFWRRHPDPAVFTRYVEGEATSAEVKEVKAHLAECSQCREQLQFFRKVERVVGELSHPSPPPGMLDEILARRDAGERVILPSSPPPLEDDRDNNHVTVLVGLALLVVGIGSFLFTSGEATAGASTLRVLPEIPRAGERIELEFRSASELASEETLRLRGWYRTAEDPPPRESLGTYLDGELSRQSAGRFSGELRLPPGAVYAAFVVENPEGTRVESNGGRLWEVLAHDDTGRPLLEALRQQFRVAESRHPSLALLLARRMTEHYPGSPEGWVHRLVYEELLFPAERDSIRQLHRRQLRRLDRSVAGAERPAPDAMASLARYGARLGEPYVEARWLERLEEAYPEHPETVRFRVLLAVDTHRKDPERLLRTLEEEWDRSGSASEYLVERGFYAALATRNPDAVRRWSKRYLERRPGLGRHIAEQMAEIPALQGHAVELLRHEAERARRVSAELRDPTLSVPETRAESREAARRVQTTLGRVLLRMGETRAGLELLAEAAAEGWDPEVFRDLLKAYLRAGDTANAFRTSAWLAADPMRRLSEDSVRVVVGEAFTRVTWPAFLDAAKREMRRRILQGADARRLDPEARIQDRDGQSSLLTDQLYRQPTLLIVCSRLAFPCTRDLPEIERAARRIISGGGSVLYLLTEQPPAVDPDFPGASLAAPVFVDAWSEVRESLGSWGIPQYVVLDETHRIRFQHRSLADAVRQVLVLEGTAAP